MEMEGNEMPQKIMQQNEQDLDPEKADFYQKIRHSLRLWAREKGTSSRWTEYLLLAPDMFHLLCKLALAREIPMHEKTALATAIAYFILPIDLMPEGFIGPIGYMDDVVLASYVLNSMINGQNPEIVKKYWAGEQDIFVEVRSVLDKADQILGGGLWQKLKNSLKQKP